MGKFAWGVKAKCCWALLTNFWKQEVCWHHPAMFCFITSSEVSRQWFEFSLKTKVMGSNPGYFPNFFYFSWKKLRSYCQKVYTVHRGKHMTWHDLLEENRFIPRAWYLSLLVNWCVWCVVHDPLVLFIPRLLPSPTVEYYFNIVLKSPNCTYCIFWCKTFR